jgi:hypothetical protein
MQLRSVIARPVRWAIERPIAWAFARAGYDVFRHIGYGRVGYGHDAFLDIDRLSSTWQYSIDVFFDVGANDGGTIRRARNSFRNCQIIAFEPHPMTFQRLTENMRNVPNTKLVNLALGSEIADKTMFECDLPPVNSLLPN